MAITPTVQSRAFSLNICDEGRSSGLRGFGVLTPGTRQGGPDFFAADKVWLYITTSAPGLHGQARAKEPTQSGRTAQTAQATT